MATTYTLTINGTQVYYKARTSYSTQEFPAARGSISGSLTVTHNTNGSKSVAVSLSTAIYTTTVSTKSGTWTLDNIGRASTVAWGSSYIGDSATYSISASNSSYTHHISFTCLGQTTVVGSSLSSGYYEFIIPVSYYDVLGSNESAEATGICKTYNGTTLIGTTAFGFTIHAKTGSEVAPILDVEAYDTNSTTYNLTGNTSAMISGYSNIYYSVSATPQNGATISSYSIVNGVYSRTATSGTFTGTTYSTVTFTVTDSRGNIARKTITLDKIEYVPLTCNLVSSNMSTAGSMTITVNGNYFNQSFGNLNNTLSVYYRYKQDNGSYSSWIAMTTSTSGNTYTATKSIIGLNADSTYVFQARAVDRLSDVSSSGSNVQNKPVFDWSGTDFNFNVPVHFAAGATGLDGGGGSGSNNITGNLTVDGGATIVGDLRLQGSYTGAHGNNYGNKIYFGDASYAYIGELTDDDLTIHATDINLDGNLYLNGRVVNSGYWTPKLNTSAVNSYSVQEGWYQIVGDTAVIGFLITATAASGYHTTNIEITGFPYDIEFRGCGGGTAYNIYTIAGHCFNSWWMEEDGTITGRVIPCNNTAAGNQSIAATCGYPNGGGSFTISGTICCRVMMG